VQQGVRGDVERGTVRHERVGVGLPPPLRGEQALLELDATTRVVDGVGAFEPHRLADGSAADRVER
jgi:hypothetical protein